MSAHTAQFEAAVLQSLLPQLEADGFAVFVHPSRTMLPTFLQDIRPDAIALREDRKIAIEVTSPGRAVRPKLDRLRDLFSAHPDWEFRVVYAPPRGIEDPIPVAPRAAVEARLHQLASASGTMEPTAALLAAWALFEAAGRLLVPGALEKPQTPARLVETLASEGVVTPDEADLLRELGRMRNAVAHGRLDLVPRQEDVERILVVTRSLLDLPD